MLRVYLKTRLDIVQHIAVERAGLEDDHVGHRFRVDGHDGTAVSCRLSASDLRLGHAMKQYHGPHWL